MIGSLRVLALLAVFFAAGTAYGAAPAEKRGGAVTLPGAPGEPDGARTGGEGIPEFPRDKTPRKRDGDRLSGTWLLPSGSVIEIEEYDDRNGRGAAFIALYKEPAVEVRTGGGSAGMFSLVGFRKGSRIEGKIWTFLPTEKNCNRPGMARDFTGEVAAGDRAITIRFISITLNAATCAQGESRNVTLTLDRVGPK